MGELVQVQSLNKRKETNDAIQQQIDKKSKMYEGDFKRFMQYAEQEKEPITFETLEAYLLHTVKSGLKLSTFNRH